jgi:hypothetical protein
MPIRYSDESENVTISPLAYMASCVIMNESKLALFGGLQRDAPSEILAASSEIVFFDMRNEVWDKPKKVFATTFDDVPSARMGSSMIHFRGKLWVYSGADPYHLKTAKQDPLPDFFSFDLESGIWRREDGFSEISAEPSHGEGWMLGQAVLMEPSDTVFFSGGCMSRSHSCTFSTSRQLILL